jgi:putative exosortase-associated protein (TIGR04073 family)
VPGLARALAIALLLGALVPGSAAAVEYTPARKAGRGLAGMTTGLLEIPGNMVRETRDRGPGWGVGLGFVTGLGKFVARTLIGVYELVTAPVEVPAGYEPILEPEFPWSYFGEPPRTQRGR